MDVFLWVYIIAIAICFVTSWWWFSLLKTVPPPPDDTDFSDAKITILIPARNEEHNLGTLLSSIRSQAFQPYEIIVIDDHSVDRTAEIAREHGARVVTAPDLPDDWFGKPWACTNGVAEATGDWLLFLDADTHLETGAMEKFAALTVTAPEAVHAIGPYHRVREPYEQLSSFFNVIMVLGMNAFTVRGWEADEIGLFGQCMLVKKADYETIGGHERVKRIVLENFHLARDFEEAGIERCCYIGKGTISMRMFPTNYRDMADGWGKGFVSGAGNTPASALFGISIWLSGLIMSTISLFLLPFASPLTAGFILGLYLLNAGQILFLFKTVGNFSFWNAALFPVSLAFYQVLFFKSMHRGRRKGEIFWKDRDVS
ncbi:MAG: glycosyltransferase family 2 protein [Verrucomicrobiales bacterium]|nr:glycosyltransferase family 2 protein [Verrucomicrobiales bacterium]